jgi:signal transduction histidine kinase
MWCGVSDDTWTVFGCARAARCADGAAWPADPDPVLTDRTAVLAERPRRAFQLPTGVASLSVYVAPAAAVIAAVLLLALSGWLERADLEQARAIDSLGDQARSVQIAANRLLSTLTDAETGQRGYLLTGDANYLQPYEAARARLSSDVTDLRAIPLVSDEGGRRLDAIEGLATAKMAELAQTIALAKAGRLPAAIAIVRADSGKEIMDAIRARLAAVETNSEADLRRARLRARSVWPPVVVVGLGMLSTLLLAGVALGQLRARRALSASLEMETKEHIQKLERSNKELDDFAYIASHDLKEPLRGLFNNAKFLHEDYADKLDADGVKRLLRLGYLSQRMEQLVNDLLYFSRLGRQDLAIQPTDLNAVIRDIEMMCETLLQERHADIVIPHALPRTLCDKTRITEVFRNLITNAVKYNESPSKRIEVGYLDEVATAAGPERQVFYVKDNGIGIAEEFYEDVFRIFKRLNTEDDDKKGSGVGLTFVRKIIERHGGRIWIDSALGAGATFYFTIEQGQAYAAAA